jgi:hypothetical protein
MRVAFFILGLAGLGSVPCGAEPSGAVAAEVATEGKTMVFRAGKREIATFQAAPGPLPRADIPVEYTRGGYVKELRTPAGVVVTEDFALGHVHHHGIWTAWTKSAFEGREPDFWNMGQKKGRMEFRNAKVSGGTIWADLAAVDMLAQPELTVLKEQWKLTAAAYQIPAFAHGVELLSTWTTATEHPVVLPEYHYGGLGFRGRAEWNGVENLRVLTSEGERDRVKANTQRAKWCWVGGLVGGKVVGAVILDHPTNFRHPQPIRLHPKEPFFCYAPQQAGEMRISPGKPYEMRYQILAIDGEPDAPIIEKFWQAFAGRP